MKKVTSLLKDIKTPPLYRVRQEFPANPLNDIEKRCLDQLASLDRFEKIQPGARIAIAVGSRGVAGIATIAASVVASMKRMGFEPYIVSAMASHGKASADGQQELLAGLGVTEEAMGCPVCADVDVVEIGRLTNGMPVYMDRAAMDGDGIILINRVKTHTAFHDQYESGLVKMLSIGLGNDRGAKICHQLGFGQIAEHIVAMAKVKLTNCPVICGVAVIEDACENVSMIEVVDADDLLGREPELLKIAKSNMPSIGIDQIDVLVVDRMGKEISGDGMDPNITGRYMTPFAAGGPTIGKLAVLSVTDKSHGNVVGIGQADVCTRRLFDAVDLETTYVNSLIATVTTVARMPMILPTDYDAIRAAILTCNILDFNEVRLVMIRDTLHLRDIIVSESLAEECRGRTMVTSVEGPFEMNFDSSGTIVPLF